MKYFKLFLKDIVDLHVEDNPTLEIYLNDNTHEVKFDKKPGMLILPGGGYEFCSDREAEPIALRFLSEGFNCFVLRYSIKSPYPIPHKEVALAFDYISKHKDEFNLMHNKLSLMGFSAGGHLASSYGFLYKNFINELNTTEENLKPFSLVLGYPVTDLKLQGEDHPTRRIITNNNPNMDSYLTAQDNLDGSYPPTFLWTTKEDQLVPIVHSTSLSEVLTQKGVENELYVFEKGWHGGSLWNYAVFDEGMDLTGFEENQTWPTLATKFVFKQLKNH